MADLSNEDVSSVGSKNASLGEMTGELMDAGNRVPDGFSTTAWAYRQFIDNSALQAKLRKQIDGRRPTERNSTLRSFSEGGQ